MQPNNQAPKQPENQQPYSHTPAQQPLATASAPNNRHKSLAIAIVVGAVFLLAAIGVAAWLLTKPETLVGTITPPADDVSNVKNIVWVPPSDMPAGYTQRDQNSESIKTTLYIDESSGCIITLNAIQLNDTNGKAPKEAVEKAVPRTENVSSTIVKNTPGESIAIKDHEGKEYQFETATIELDVNVPGVDFKKQFNSVSYKQFGTKVAAISYACKDASWEAKKGELQELAKKFTLKTER